MCVCAREKQKERECVCVCICMCVRARDPPTPSPFFWDPRTQCARTHTHTQAMRLLSSFFRMCLHSQTQPRVNTRTEMGDELAYIGERLCVRAECMQKKTIIIIIVFITHKLDTVRGEHRWATRWRILGHIRMVKSL